MKVRAITLASLAPLLLFGDAHATRACGSPTEAHTLQMEVVPETQTVHRGNSARFDVTVTRGVDEHNGSRTPAEGVDVWLVLSPRWRPMWRRAVTEADGTATITLRIGTGARLGETSAVGFALIEHARTVCGLTVSEWDDWKEARIVTVAPEGSTSP